MKISFLALIVGIIVGVLVICLLYYSAYKSFDFIFKIRHPLKSNSTALPPPEKKSISEWMNSFGEHDIAFGDVFLFDKNGLSISIDETRKKLKVVKFNHTDKMQKWKLFFFRDPNDPHEETEGVIYNIATNKYISFKNGDIILEDLPEPYTINVPIGSFVAKSKSESNKLSDLNGEFWITVDYSNHMLKTTENKKNATEFFVMVN